MTVISLVVPVRNEASTLLALVDSIRRQTRPPGEVVIVDGGSTDGTVEMVRRLATDDPGVRFIEAGEATPGKGRNVGIAASRHEWVALTDAGVILDPDWLASLEEASTAHPDARLIWGTYEPQVAGFLDECAEIAFVPAKRPTADGPVRGPSVASCLLHRTAWERAGGFPDLRAAEDLIFVERLERSGIECAWAPDAIAHWSLPPTLAATFRRFRTYSEVNARAGRQSEWHHGVARLYGAGAAVALGALVLDRRLWGLFGAGAVARVAKSVLVHRDGRPLTWVLNLLRFAGVAGLLLVVDAATFAGWLDATVHRNTAST